jgi:hypothetical protein
MVTTLAMTMAPRHQATSHHSWILENVSGRGKGTELSSKDKDELLKNCQLVNKRNI